MKHRSLLLVCLLALQACTMPLTPAPVIMSIETAAPGASAEQVESAVTVPIEQALVKMTGVLNIRSTSSQSRSCIEVHFTGPTARQAMKDVNSLLVELKNVLPGTTLPSIVTVIASPNSSDVPAYSAGQATAGCFQLQSARTATALHQRSASEPERAAPALVQAAGVWSTPTSSTSSTSDYGRQTA